MTTDPARLAPEEAAGSGEQPEARRKKPATVTGPRRPNFEPKWPKGAEMEKEKERRPNSRQCSENTLYTVFHIPPTETATATTAATVRHNGE